MTEKRRRILESWHDHDGGLTFYITRHDEGAGPVYRLESVWGIQEYWGDEAGAMNQATELLAERGHECTDRCQPWRPPSHLR